MARLYVLQQLCGQHEAEKDVDREQENEIGYLLAQLRSAAVDPILYYKIGSLWDAQKIEPETKQPFRVHVIDDGVGNLFCISKCFGRAPRAETAQDVLDHHVKINGG